MTGEGFQPLFPKLKLSERPDGLIVAREQYEPEVRKQRREDNKAMAKSRKFHRRRKQHGRP